MAHPLPGRDWDLARVRGTRHNTGDGIRMALEVGAQPYGHWSSLPRGGVGPRAPAFGDRAWATCSRSTRTARADRQHRGERFVDEGADFRNYTYAKYGREILAPAAAGRVPDLRPEDGELLREEYRIREVTKAEASTIEELARSSRSTPRLARTVREFNAAVRTGAVQPGVLDGKGTAGSTPPKSNWALPLDSPPYVGFGVTCGITFTFGGLRVDTRAQVLDTRDRPIPGLYAAGELVGGLFYHNYPGGTGLMSGAVFGKTAGDSAAAFLAQPAAARALAGPRRPSIRDAEGEGRWHDLAAGRSACLVDRPLTLSSRADR